MKIIILLLIALAVTCSIISNRILNRTFKQMDDLIDSFKQNNMELVRYSKELFHGDWYK